MPNGDASGPDWGEIARLQQQVNDLKKKTEPLTGSIASIIRILEKMQTFTELQGEINKLVLLHIKGEFHV